MIEKYVKGKERSFDRIASACTDIIHDRKQSPQEDKMII